MSIVLSGHMLVEQLHGILIAPYGFILVRSVPSHGVLEAVLDGCVPHHDTKQVILNHSIGHFADGRVGSCSLGTKKDSVAWSIHFDWESLPLLRASSIVFHIIESLGILK